MYHSLSTQNETHGPTHQLANAALELEGLRHILMLDWQI